MLEQYFLTTALKIIVLKYSVTIVTAVGVIGPHFIQNEDNCMCLDLKDGYLDMGGRIITAKCARKTTQLWDLHNVGNGFLIVNRASGLPLDIEHGKKKPGAYIIQWLPNQSCNQRWTFDSDGTIRNGKSNLVFDICCPARGKESPVIAYTKHGKMNQRFRIIPLGDIRPYQI